MVRRIGSLSLRSLIGIALAFALVVAAIVAPLAFRSARRLVDEACDRSYLSARAFAQSATVWIDRQDDETLLRVSNLMLSASSVYILIVQNGVRIVAETRQNSPQFEERWIADPMESRSTLHRANETWYVDTLIPMPSNASEAPIGYVRVGTDVSFLAARLSAGWLRATFAWTTIWIALTGLLAAAAIWARRRCVRSTPTDGPDHHPPSETGPRVLGELVLDTARREVSVCGVPVGLTPKQFDLMVVLTASDRRVFSETEILGLVWPESAYADSNDIRQCIYRLRQRFRKAHPGAEASIVNVKGFGYQFDPGRLTKRPCATSHEEGGENA